MSYGKTQTYVLANPVCWVRVVKAHKLVLFMVLESGYSAFDVYDASYRVLVDAVHEFKDVSLYS